ncbi:hypothetical protein TWF281_001639 [Arthrobotrys megalospora]
MTGYAGIRDHREAICASFDIVSLRSLARLRWPSNANAGTPWRMHVLEISPMGYKCHREWQPQSFSSLIMELGGYKKRLDYEWSRVRVQKPGA